TRIPTTSPAETLAAALAFFEHQGSPAALGVASFGPIDLDERSPTHGFITTTPKAGWAHTDVVGPLRRALGVPVAFDTDVNAAALAEQRWGAARDAGSVVYVTVGTGIGGGAVVNGRPVHGLAHPEMGHARIPHDRATAVATRRPPRLGPRGALPRPRPGQYHPHAVPRTPGPRRRRARAKRSAG